MSVTASDWAKGIGYSVAASIIGGASKLAIRKSWLMVQQRKRNAVENSVEINFLSQTNIKETQLPRNQFESPFLLIESSSDGSDKDDADGNGSFSSGDAVSASNVSFTLAEKGAVAASTEINFVIP
jgi:hypothetical protein